MIVVDSSGWIEYLLDEANAGEFAPAIESRELVIPTICVYEVHRFFLSRTSDPELFKKLREAMSGGVVVPLQASLAMEAANLSKAHRFPMADSIILATARHHGAAVWTQDTHFAELPDVKFFPKH